MELNFVETIEGKEWVAEFEAPSDFNLHLERKASGSLVVSQRGTSSGEYDVAFVKSMYEGGMVIDYDFGALVYPKYIKVVSGSKVLSASVNFNEGGGSGSGESGEIYTAKYYKFKSDFDRSNMRIDYFLHGIAALQCFTIKGVWDNETVVAANNDLNYSYTQAKKLIAFSFTPQLISRPEENFIKYCYTLDDFNGLFGVATENAYLVTDFEEITEEEYCDLNNDNGV